MTPRGIAMPHHDREGGTRTKSASCPRAGSFLAPLALHPRPVLRSPVPEADARSSEEPEVPRIRAAPADATHHDDPSPGDEELSGVSDRALHRHRGFRAGAPRDTADPPGLADRPDHSQARRLRPRCGADRVRAEAP